MSEPNPRFEAVVVELADLIHDEHLWECTYKLPCEGTTCASDRARAVLAYLHGAGLIYWGRGANPMPSRPEGREPYAVRIQAEFWTSTGEQTEAEAEKGIQNYAWVGGALAVRSGYPGKVDTPTATFLDGYTQQQRDQILPMLRALVAELQGQPLPVPEFVGISRLVEMADTMRARLEYDNRRGISTNAGDRWRQLGYDVARVAGLAMLRSPSEAVSKLFYAPAWKPTDEELAHFRNGFALQRRGQALPQARG